MHTPRHHTSEPASVSVRWLRMTVNGALLRGVVLMVLAVLVVSCAGGAVQERDLRRLPLRPIKVQELATLELTLERDDQGWWLKGLAPRRRLLEGQLLVARHHARWPEELADQAPITGWFEAGTVRSLKRTAPLSPVVMGGSLPPEASQRLFAMGPTSMGDVRDKAVGTVSFDKGWTLNRGTPELVRRGDVYVVLSATPSQPFPARLDAVFRVESVALGSALLGLVVARRQIRDGEFLFWLGPQPVLSREAFRDIRDFRAVWSLREDDTEERKAFLERMEQSLGLRDVEPVLSADASPYQLLGNARKEFWYASLSRPLMTLWIDASPKGRRVHVLGPGLEALTRPGVFDAVPLDALSNEAFAWWVRVATLYQLKRWPELLWLTAQPDTVPKGFEGRARLLQAEALGRMFRYNGALALLDERRDPAATVLRAELLHALGREAEAVAILVESINSSDAVSVDVAWHRAWLLLQWGQLETWPRHVWGELADPWVLTALAKIPTEGLWLREQGELVERFLDVRRDGVVLDDWLSDVRMEASFSLSALILDEGARLDSAREALPFKRRAAERWQAASREWRYAGDFSRAGWSLAQTLVTRAMLLRKTPSKEVTPKQLGDLIVLALDAAAYFAAGADREQAGDVLLLAEAWLLTLEQRGEGFAKLDHETLVGRIMDHYGAARRPDRMMRVWQLLVTRIEEGDYDGVSQAEALGWVNIFAKMTGHVEMIAKTEVALAEIEMLAGPGEDENVDVFVARVGARFSTAITFIESSWNALLAGQVYWLASMNAAKLKRLSEADASSEESSEAPSPRTDE